MSTYENAMYMFLEQAKDLGIKIHNDYQLAEKIFKAIEQNTNFDSIVTQITADNLLKECKAFGSVILDWNENYPRILGQYRQVLLLVIMDLQQIQGIKIVRSSDQASITFDNKEFIYHFNDNITSDTPNIQISDESKTLIALEENKIVQEIAEVLSLELYIARLLEYIELLDKTKYNIQAAAHTLTNLTKIDSPELIVNLHTIALWWKELRTTLDKLKELTRTAVQMDEKVTKELEKVFDQEKKQSIRDTKLRAAKAGVTLLGGIALSFVPGSTAISAAISLYQERKIYKEALDILKR